MGKLTGFTVTRGLIQLQLLSTQSQDTTPKMKRRGFLIAKPHSLMVNYTYRAVLNQTLQSKTNLPYFPGSYRKTDKTSGLTRLQLSQLDTDGKLSDNNLFSAGQQVSLHLYHLWEGCNLVPSHLLGPHCPLLEEGLKVGWEGVGHSFYQTHTASGLFIES